MKYNLDDILSSYFNDQLSRIGHHESTEIIINIMQRIAFLEYINRITNIFTITSNDRAFIRSLEVYLLLSASDALGKGHSYYSLIDFVTDRNNKSFIHSIEAGDTSLFQKIETIYREYNRVFSIKNRFHNFWSKRSSYIKQKVVGLYHPYELHYFERLYPDIIGNIFYNLYRNKFTHEAINLVPPLRNYNDNDAIKGEIIGISVEIPDFPEPVLIDVPLNHDEANNIINKKYKTYITNRQLVKADNIIFTDAIELIKYSSLLNSDVIQGGEILNNGLPKVIKMALYECCMELEREECNWEKLSHFYI
jgi:hypothetical protein